MSASERIVFAVGNPGARYSETRHNVGFRVVDEIARRAQKSFRKSCELFMVADLEGGGALVKPLTFVNRSGRAFAHLLAERELDLGAILVVVDDVNLDIGRLRVKAQGSSGGHNGLRDIAAVTGSEAWPRLRIGVGSPPAGADLVEHVLGRFDPAEEEILGPTIDRAVVGAEAFLEGRPLENLMVACNRAFDAVREDGGAGVQKESEIE